MYPNVFKEGRQLPTCQLITMISGEREFRNWCQQNDGRVQDVEDDVMCTIRGRDTGVGGGPSHVDAGTETITYQPSRDTVTLDFHFEDTTGSGFQTSGRSRVNFPTEQIDLHQGGLTAYDQNGRTQAEYIFQHSGDDNPRL